MTFGFWNIGRKDLSDSLVDLVTEQQIDILVVAEADDRTILDFLTKNNKINPARQFNQIFRSPTGYTTINDMTMTNKNIWKNLDFSKSSTKSAYDYLMEQSEPLTAATSGELKMEVDVVRDGQLDSDPPKLVILYMLYVVVPKLGNFRRKILTVAEYNEIGQFPVEIFSHLDNEKLLGVAETEFLDKVAHIMQKDVVKTSIEMLYRQSKEYKTKG